MVYCLAFLKTIGADLGDILSRPRSLGREREQYFPEHECKILFQALRDNSLDFHSMSCKLHVPEHVVPVQCEPGGPFYLNRAMVSNGAAV